MNDGAGVWLYLQLRPPLSYVTTGDDPPRAGRSGYSPSGYQGFPPSGYSWAGPP